MPLPFYNGSAMAGASTSTIAESLSVLGDANPRFTNTVSGDMKWGGGTGATDCELNRTGAGVMTLTASFTCTAVITGNTIVSNVSLTSPTVTATGVIQGGGVVGTSYVQATTNLLVGASPLTGGGSGVVAIENATTVPTTNPTGGGVLYASSGVPTWRDSGGQKLGMSKHYNAQATGTLSSFTTEADVPGATVSVVVTGASATVKVQAVFDCTGVATIVGFLNWNGSDQTVQAIFVGSATTSRSTIAQQWLITGVAAGTYTAKLRASSSASATTNRVLNPHTGLIVEVIEG